MFVASGRLKRLDNAYRRGQQFKANWMLLVRLNRLTGHGVLSSIVKGTLCHFGRRMRYHPRRWQRYI